MNNRRSLRQVVVALFLSVAFLSQGTWALAGTTGSLSGQVTGDGGAPIAGAFVKVSSPSQTNSTTTDAGGHFNFLSLAPDSYVVTATKDGYAPSTYPGVTIFADQSLTLQMQLQKALKNIASVTARSQGSLVKPGTTADVYSVNAAGQTAVQGIGGGYNLDSAYSAIYSQPGVTSQIGNYGFGQVYYIRGSSYSQVGYEYDGVPVNRAFDNYNANSLSNVGSQETEVYTGGSPAGGSSATLAGYINQVIKTGTFPGYANLNGGVGVPAFYHKAGAEAGGATPDRNFSYYVGIQGSNETYNTGDNCNLCSQAIDGSGSNGIFSSSFNATTALLSYFTNGTYSDCPKAGGTLAAGSQTYEGLTSCNIYTPWSGSGLLGLPIVTQDRENVMNFHFGIPHHNDSGKDDVQLLYYNFAYHQYFGDSINDQGGLNYLDSGFPDWSGKGGIAAILEGRPTKKPFPYPGDTGPYSDLCAFQIFVAGGCATTGGSPLSYIDTHIFAPGTTFGQNASTAIADPYLAASQPGHPFLAGVPASGEDTTWNDGTVMKLQYQKNIGSSAYVRLLGYTFYSDWLMSSPNAGNEFITGYGYGDAGFGYPSPDYELNTHTRGIQLQAADQINAENLITFTGNYTTATVTRWNNEWYAAPGGVTNLVGANGQCYTDEANSTGTITAGQQYNCLSSLTAGSYSAPLGTFAKGNSACANLPGTAACAAGANFVVTVPQGYGTLNNVRPEFSSFALQDEWRPSDRWDINGGIRFEDYQYDFPSTVSSEFNFWWKQAQNAYCYDPVSGQPLLNPVSPSSAPGNAGPQVLPNILAGENAGLCYTPAGAPYLNSTGQQYRHPNGVGGSKLYSDAGPATVSHSMVSPRIGGTYTISPDAVLRFNYGIFTQPTETAFEQYTNASGLGAAKFDFQHFWGLGFTTPVHDNPVQVSHNYDLSFEYHLKNTDWSAKLSPFYRWTTNQLVTVSLGGNFASGINAATQQTQGVELSIQKGDPSRNGLSGQLSYTYTKARMQFQTLANGSNAIDVLNNYITAFNALTKAGGGSPYYCGGSGSGPNAGPNGTNKPAGGPGGCGPKQSAIFNPYFSQPEQGLMDRNGWYAPYANAPPSGAPGDVSTAIVPNAFAGFVNWRKNRFAITIPFQINSGTSYGSPTAIYGLDPRSCGANQLATGHAVAGSTYQYAADYQTCSFSAFTSTGYLAIPNPQNGNHFDGLGQYQEPWQFNMGVQLAYDVTPKIKATVTFANVVNTCFGGTVTGWSNTYKPNSIDCSYVGNGYYYVGQTPGAGFFYGGSPKTGNGNYPAVFNQSYQPLYGAIPFQVYGNLQIRL